MKKIALAIVTIPLLFSACTKEKKQDFPNILFIMADDLGYADLSSYGAEKIKTPNIDKLAEKGIRHDERIQGGAI